MGSFDAWFLSVVSRTEMAYLMIAVDTICAAITVYIAILISRSFGFGNFEQLLQMMHRVSLLAIAIFFAWHAEDIATHTDAHGLTPGNLFLHIGWIIGIGLSGIRLHRAMRHEADQLERKRRGNGGMLSGPFPIH